MNTARGVNKRKKIIAFSSAFLLTIILTIFLLSFLWNKNNDLIRRVVSENGYIQYPAKNNIMVGNLAILNDRINVLCQLDEQYINLVKTPDNKSQLEDVNKLINGQEKNLRILLDSIALRTRVQLDDSQKQVMNNIVSGYKSILNSHNSMNQTLSILNSGNNNLQPPVVAHSSKKKRRR